MLCVSKRTLVFSRSQSSGLSNWSSTCPKEHFKETIFHWKKIIVLKIGNWAEKTWPLAQFFSVGLTKLDSTCLEEPFEKNFRKSKGFSFNNRFEQRTKKNSASWINFLARMSKFRFTCPQEQFEETFVWNFAKFSISFGHSAKILLKKAGERHRGVSSETFVTSKRYTEEALSTYPKICGFEKQNLRQASRSYFRSLLSNSNRSFCFWDLLSVHAIVWQRVHLRAIKCSRMKK